MQQQYKRKAEDKIYTVDQYTEENRSARGLCGDADCEEMSADHVHTASGPVAVEFGDYLMPEPRPVKNRRDGTAFYPIKRDIFEKSYEPFELPPVIPTGKSTGLGIERYDTLQKIVEQFELCNYVSVDFNHEIKNNIAFAALKRFAEIPGVPLTRENMTAYFAQMAEEDGRSFHTTVDWLVDTVMLLQDTVVRDLDLAEHADAIAAAAKEVIEEVVGEEVPMMVVPEGKKVRGPFVQGEKVELVDDER